MTCYQWKFRKNVDLLSYLLRVRACVYRDSDCFRSTKESNRNKRYFKECKSIGGEKNHFFVQHYRNKVDNFQEYVAEEEQFYDGCRKYQSKFRNSICMCSCCENFSQFRIIFFLFCFFLFWQVWQHTFKVWQLQIACLSRVTRFCELCQCIIRFSGMQLELILWIRLRGMLHEKLHVNLS